MTTEKRCPVCGSTVWDYDVVEYSTGTAFCGGCMDEVLRVGRQMNLMTWHGTGLVFANAKNFQKAVVAARG